MWTNYSHIYRFDSRQNIQTNWEWHRIRLVSHTCADIRAFTLIIVKKLCFYASCILDSLV